MENYDELVSFEQTYDYEDDDNNCHFVIDGYPLDENKSGAVVAEVTETVHHDIVVTYFINYYRSNPIVTELIADTIKDIKSGKRQIV